MCIGWERRARGGAPRQDWPTESFGLPAWRIGSAAEFAPRLAHALTLDMPSLLAVPVDYPLDVAMTADLGAPTTAT